MKGILDAHEKRREEERKKKEAEERKRREAEEAERRREKENSAKSVDLAAFGVVFLNLMASRRHLTRIPLAWPLATVRSGYA